MKLFKTIGLRILAVAMVVALLVLKFSSDDDGEGIMSRWPQVVAALVLFLGVIAWALNFGKIFVYWFADWIVDFIYGARGSFVENPPALPSKRAKEKLE